MLIHHNFKKIVKSTLILCVILISIKSEAMSLYFEKPESEIRVGDTVMLNIFLDTENIEVNGIEGVAKISGAGVVSNLNVAGSVFSLWPNKPSLLGEEVSFVGGTPSGVFGKKNKVFSIFFKATEVGKVNLSIKQADVFLNDGKGTKLALLGINEVLDISKSINESKNELSNLIINDKVLPNPFKIELGKDPNMFDGKYFISFYSTDDMSGINRYEVRENNLPAVRSGNTYVLEDQSLSGKVEVKVIDNAGNFTIKTIDLKEKDNKYNSYILLLIIIIICILLYFKIKKIRKSKKKNKK